MPKLRILNRAGEKRVIEVDEGGSVMEAIRDNGFDELLALSGSACSCATCHVHVVPAFMESFPPIEEQEEDLLDFLEHLDAFSRLPCQLRITAAHDGHEVKIARRTEREPAFGVRAARSHDEAQSPLGLTAFPKWQVVKACAGIRA